MSFYLYDEPLRLYLHYTICWVLKTYNLYSCGCIFVVEVTWTELTGDYLAFSGTIKPARWYRHLRQDFFLIYGSCSRVFLKSMREKPIFSMKRYRLPSSCIRQPCLLPRSDAQLTPHRSPRRDWIPYSRLPHNPFFSHREYYSYYIIHCSYYGY